MAELTFSGRYLLALTYARNNVDSTVNNLIRNNLKPIKAKTTIVSQIFSSFSVVSDRVHFNVLITSLVIICSLIVSFSCHQLVRNLLRILLSGTNIAPWRGYLLKIWHIIEWKYESNLFAWLHFICDRFMLQFCVTMTLTFMHETNYSYLITILFSREGRGLSTIFSHIIHLILIFLTWARYRSCDV